MLPPENRVPGFAIPFSLYRDWMASTGLQARLEAFLADPRTRGDASFRRAGLKGLRDAIEDATVPAAIVDRLATLARAAFGEGYARTPIRLRSSSNVEDGELVSGAGLYDSARGCFADDADADEAGPSACVSEAERTALQAELDGRRAEAEAHPERTWIADIVKEFSGDLTKERSVARALKKVYASLWNDRAFEEREYAGVDHRAAFMGVAVGAAFVLERLNAVAVTNLPPAATDPPGGPRYRVVSQQGDNSVVRPPDPSLVAETLTLRRGPDGRPTDVTVVVPSSLSPQPLWSEARLANLARLMFLIQDHFAAEVYKQQGAQLRLDLEN